VKGSDDRNPGTRPLAGSAARRVEAIIEGAEKAAERVIDEAEAKARDYLAEAEAEADRAIERRLAALGGLTDALVAQADAIRRQSELLTRSLREAKERLEAGAEPSGAEGGDSDLGGERRSGEWPGAEEPSGGRDAILRTPHLTAVGPVLPPERPEESEREPGAERPEPGSNAGARLLATQMAVSGSSREEIAARLRNGFETEDADAILDAILGPDG
jgi:hypothetical protein